MLPDGAGSNSSTVGRVHGSGALPLADDVDVLLQQVIADVVIGLKVAHGHLGPLAQD